MNRKEEILNQFNLSNESSDELGTRMDDIDDAMDLIAKEESISFLQWVIKEGYEVHSVDAFMKLNSGGHSLVLTAKQLYEMYLKSKTN